MTSRKAYCKQLNPHSFIKIQTNKTNPPTPKKKRKKEETKKERKKGMFSDVEITEGDFVTPFLDLWDN